MHHSTLVIPMLLFIHVIILTSSTRGGTAVGMFGYDRSDDDDDDDNDDDDDESDVKPVFKQTPTNITASPGDRAVLKCRVEHLGAKTVTWRRLGDIHPMTIGVFTFISDIRISVEYNQRTTEWSLIIQDVRPSDEGVYQSQVNTKDDQSNFYNIYLHVKTIQVTGTEIVDRGGPIQLVCNATGRPDPPDNVEWYKEDRMIESNAHGGIIITKKIETRLLVSVLAIRRSKMTDAGEYHCRSSNHDIGRILVTILNAPLEKRGTSAEKITSGSSVPASFSRLKHVVLALLLFHRWQHRLTHHGMLLSTDR